MEEFHPLIIGIFVVIVMITIFYFWYRSFHAKDGKTFYIYLILFMITSSLVVSALIENDPDLQSSGNFYDSMISTQTLLFYVGVIILIYGGYVLFNSYNKRTNTNWQDEPNTFKLIFKNFNRKEKITLVLILIISYSLIIGSGII